MTVPSTRRIEEFGHLGQQFRDMLTRLGYDRDPEVSGHTIRTLWNEEIVRATLVVYPNHALRGSRAGSRRHQFTAEGEDFVDATIHVVRAGFGLAFFSSSFAKTRPNLSRPVE